MKIQRQIGCQLRPTARLDKPRSHGRAGILPRRSLAEILLSLAVVSAVLALWAPAAHPAGGDEALAGHSPEATIDLATRQGVQAVRGAWRYSDTKIVEVDFRAAGADGQPTGAPNRAYDFEPHAGGTYFDDSAWEVIDPASLARRRSPGRLAFNWYRIGITVPERIGKFDPTGSTVVFATAVDDYAEIWVDGELPRAAGQSGGSVIKGWNAENRLIVGRNVRPGQKIQLAIFGINGPLSNPPTNYIYVRRAELEFHKLPSDPVAGAPREVNVEVQRLDPAIDAIVPPNPKLYKLAEGFQSAAKPVCTPDGDLLLKDPETDRTYRYAPDETLSVLANNSNHSSTENYFDLPVAPGKEATDGTAVDRQGNLYVSGPGGLRVFSPEGRHLGTIKMPRDPHGIAWGGEDGQTLYVTAGNALYRMPLKIPGVPRDERGGAASLRPVKR